jgi:hypothetical protein
VIHSLIVVKLNYSAGLDALFPSPRPDGGGDDGESGHDQRDRGSCADYRMGRLAFVLRAHGVAPIASL